MAKCKYCGKEIYEGYLNGKVEIIEEYDTYINKNAFDIRQGTIISKRVHSCNIQDIKLKEK